ncbi:MAG: hypothetical protein NT096_06770 [Proteobacteria bacterium]|nr:hypothetical protein [Pseudomonadota bacterium]
MAGIIVGKDDGDGRDIRCNLTRLKRRLINEKAKINPIHGNDCFSGIFNFPFEK